MIKFLNKNFTKMQQERITNYKTNQPLVTRNHISDIPTYNVNTEVPNYLKDVDIVFKFFVHNLLPLLANKFKYLNPPTTDHFLWRLGLAFNEYRSKDMQRWHQILEFFLNLYTRHRLASEFWRIAGEYGLQHKYSRYLHDCGCLYWKNDV